MSYAELPTADEIVAASQLGRKNGSASGQLCPTQSNVNVFRNKWPYDVMLVIVFVDKHSCSTQSLDYTINSHYR